MKTKPNYPNRGQHEYSIMRSIVASVTYKKDFVKNERIEWLKKLYAEWLKKRNSTLNNNHETYKIGEPD